MHAFTKGLSVPEYVISWLFVLPPHSQSQACILTSQHWTEGAVICACMCMCVCVCICIFVCVYVCMYTHIHACMYTYIHTSYTHTHTGAPIHIHMQPQRLNIWILYLCLCSTDTLDGKGHKACPHTCIHAPNAWIYNSFFCVCAARIHWTEGDKACQVDKANYKLGLAM